MHFTPKKKINKKDKKQYIVSDNKDTLVDINKLPHVIVILGFTMMVKLKRMYNNDVNGFKTGYPLFIYNK